MTTRREGASEGDAVTVADRGGVLRLSEDLPIVVEIVDESEKIEAFLPVLDEMMAEGMVTVERAKVITYRHHARDGEA